MPSSVDTDERGDDGSKSTLTKLGQPHFDPVDFLNDALPHLTLSTQTLASKASRSTQVQGAATEALALFSSLNTINIRSSSELSSLTDEIIRSGNRLAYEVEVLRGDVNGFHELLTESSREDIDEFVKDEAMGHAAPSLDPEVDGGEMVHIQAPTDEPEFMARLRLLSKVKTRLESVITIFGEAMKWPVPPSEVSGASLISVSAPELGIQSSAEDDKANEILKQIRAEIGDILASDAGEYTGVEAASRKVEEYAKLATLWKGTGEEKARLKFVDSLAKLVEDRSRALDARGAARNQKQESSARSSSATARNMKSANEGGGATGLFRNLQRLKDDLYFE
ncbi:hypothetical protein A1O7_07793 [Cladophialophora yegresii CBS 114405]|uniref:Uncharacterized protein n=1 Tax=Cladophialophora yegresii CBS 114405 TaxID=1182544 RepID=W9VXL6_9EURO|nr:uncharacterized protein A1O7_07793 [Cladophialophora yegresii CBS 114405]EXJ57445.1 hypothetical protein A1O7_07793 [Cladophialophora yegresii CBS 114405]